MLNLPLFKQITANVNNVLDEGSKKYRVDLHYLSKGGFWLTSIQVFTAIVGLILSIIYARFVPVIIYGQYNFVLSFVAFFGSLVYPGMNAALIRATAQGREGFYKKAIKKTLPVAVLSSLPLLGIAFYYGLKPKPDQNIILAFIICAIVSIINWSFNYYHGYFVGKGKLKKLFFVSATVNFVTAFALSMVSVFKPTLVFLLLAGLGASAIQNLLISEIIMVQIKEEKCLDSDLSLAKGLNDPLIFSSLSVFADKIILGKMLGFEAVAIFSFAQLIPQHLKGFLKNFSTLALPKLSQIDIQKNRRKLVSIFGYFFVLSAIVVAIYTSIAPVLFRYLFPTYLDSVIPSQIIAVSLLASPSLIVNSVLQSQANVSALRWKMYPTYIARPLLIAFLSYKFDVLGAAVAILLSSVVALMMGVMVFNNVYKRHEKS